MNPEISGPYDQYSDYGVWMTDEKIWPGPDKYVRFGRHTYGPHYLRGRLDWTASLKPPADQLALLENCLLVKEPIRYRWDDAWPYSRTHCPFPRCCYMRPHFIGHRTLPVDTIINCRWYLFYSDDDPSGANIGPFSFLDGGDQKAMFRGYVQDTDSFALSGEVTSEDPTLAYTKGWVLVLLKRILVQDNPIDPVTVTFHIYGGWKLTGPTRIWDPTKTTEWSIWSNHLNFPPHRLYLEPFSV